MANYIGTRRVFVPITDDYAKLDFDRGICQLSFDNDPILFSEKYEWGYMGVYPMNLSRLLLAHFFNVNDPDNVPYDLVFRFCNEKISKLDTGDWKMDAEELRIYLNEIYYEMYEDT